MSYRGYALIAVVAGCLAVWAGTIAIGYVLAYHGETALLAAGCVLYVGLVAWNWRQARQRARAGISWRLPTAGIMPLRFVRCALRCGLAMSNTSETL